MKYEKSPLYETARGVVGSIDLLDMLGSIGALAAFIAWLHHFFNR